MNKILTKTPAFVRFSIKEQTLFAKRMAFLIKAGVPVIECLHVIKSQTKSPRKINIFNAIIHDVANGQYLSTSLRKFNNFFGDFAINIIRVGEQSGILSQNLAYLADELTKKYALQRKVVGAMVYPVFITTATLGITSVLTVYIFPKLVPVFVSLHVDLPLTTRILIGVSNFLQAWGIYSLILLTVLGILFAVVRKRVYAVRYTADYCLLSVPFAGSLMRAYNLTNFTRTLGLMLRSGVHLTEGIAIVGQTTRNVVYKRAYEKVAANIIKGEPLSRNLLAFPRLFPDMLAHMIHVGETTGNLSQTLTYLAEMYEAEVDEQTKSLSSSIEPVLMIVMGLLVGLIAVSVITPIYEITQHLQPK